jgi:glutaminyl-tRNA synthetase
LEQLPIDRKPRQIEFAPLNLTYTVLSKRRLLQLVRDGHVRGWDDPRMPTLRGMRRRGITPTAIRRFIDRIGVSKVPSTIDMALLDHVLREELNKTAPRVMAVIHPLKITIENYPEGEAEWFDADNNPEDPDAGTRKIPFGREIYIERDDFMEDPPKKFFRLAPGREIRLKHAYYITCTDVIKEPETGRVVELVCSYDPASRGGWTDDGRKVKGTSHWVSVEHGVEAEVRLYDYLFTRENPADVEEGKTFIDYINPDSLEVVPSAVVEPSLTNPEPGATYQFLRQGYYCVDPDSRAGCPVFNRTVGLRDTWAKIKNKK